MSVRVEESPDTTDDDCSEPATEKSAVDASSTHSQRSVIRAVAVLLVAGPTLVLMAFLRTNPYVPPGHEGYIYERPRVYGSGGFLGTITGPGNPGVSLFRHESINIDMLPQTYTEQFNVLAQDDLTIAFRFHAVISVERGSVVRVVNEFGGADWYERFVKETFRNIVRDSVQRRKSTEVKASMLKFAEGVTEQLAEYLHGTPFHLVRLVVGDIDYPKPVADAVERKLAAQQLLEEKDTQEQIALMDAKIEIEKARGKAQAQQIIDATLTTNYLQHEAIAAQAKLADSPNNTTVYIPLGPTGLPLVHVPKGPR